MAITLLPHPFRRMAELQRRVQGLTVIVDDIIDAWPPTTTAAAGDGTAALPVTGPIRGQELVMSAWSCKDPGRGLTVAQAKQITRGAHRDCPNDRAVCRIKHAAMRLLIDEGVLVPAGRNYSAR